MRHGSSRRWALVWSSRCCTTPTRSSPRSAHSTDGSTTTGASRTKRRLFAAPYLTLVDLDAAIAELEWSLDRGARIVCVRTAPVTLANQTISPFLEEFDAFWARVAEARIVTAFHGGDTGYAHHVADGNPRRVVGVFRLAAAARHREEPGTVRDDGRRDLSQGVRSPPTIAFRGRRERLRLAARSAKKLDLAATQSGGWFSERPSDTFRRHVWVTPFWEDDPAEAAELIGVERTLFGSDWPHAEGIAEPISYAGAIESLGDAAVQRIMRDNFRELMT